MTPYTETRRFGITHTPVSPDIAGNQAIEAAVHVAFNHRHRVRVTDGASLHQTFKDDLHPLGPAGTPTTLDYTQYVSRPDIVIADTPPQFAIVLRYAMAKLIEIGIPVTDPELEILELAKPSLDQIVLANYLGLQLPRFAIRFVEIINEENRHFSLLATTQHVGTVDKAAFDKLSQILASLRSGVFH